MLVGALIIFVITITGKWQALWETLKGFANKMPGWASVLLAVFLPIVGIPLLLIKYWDKAVEAVKKFFGLKGEQPAVPEAAKVAVDNPVKIPATIDMGNIGEQLKAFNIDGMGDLASLNIPANMDLSQIQQQSAELQTKMGATGENASLELAKGLTSPEGTAQITNSAAAISSTITGALPQPEASYQHGQNLGQSLADGLISKESQVREAAKLLATAVHDNLGVSSPTKEGPLSTNHLWGGNLVRSIAGGMLDKLALIKGASAVVADVMALNGRVSGDTGYSVASPARGGIVVHGPLIGAIYQQPGESNEDLVQRIKRELGFEAEQANLTLGRLSFAGVR